MKIYIQSKSGDYNSWIELSCTLHSALGRLRDDGGYYTEDEKKFIPFEEIRYIKEYEDEIV